MITREDIEWNKRLLQKQEYDEFHGKKYRGFTLCRFRQKNGVYWKAQKRISGELHTVYISIDPRNFRTAIDKYIADKDLQKSL